MGRVGDNPEFSGNIGLLPELSDTSFLSMPDPDPGRVKTGHFSLPKYYSPIRAEIVAPIGPIWGFIFTTENR